jgi:hypothetical protein
MKPLLSMVAAMLIMAAGAAAQTGDGAQIEWQVVGSGGSMNLESTNYRMNSTLGQPTGGGPSGSADYRLGHGFWSIYGISSGTCCIARVGDANNLGGDEPTIGDISVLIDALFITGTCDGVIPCVAEADINQSGGPEPTCDDITIGDISILIDYLFITGSSLGLPDCL